MTLVCPICHFYLPSKYSGDIKKLCQGHDMDEL